MGDVGGEGMGEMQCLSVCVMGMDLYSFFLHCELVCVCVCVCVCVLCVLGGGGGGGRRSAFPHV